MSSSTFFSQGAPFMKAPAPNMCGTITASEMQNLEYPSDVPSIAGNSFALSPEDTNMWASSTVNPSCIDTSGVNDVQPYLANAQPFQNLASNNSLNNRRRNLEEAQLDQGSISYRFRHGQVTPPDLSPTTSKSATLQPSIEGPTEGPTKRRRTGGSRARCGSRSASTRGSTSVEPSSPGDDKQEKTRARNRLAASKCRQKKKEQNSQLKSKFEYERLRHEELIRTVNSLRDDIVAAKDQLLAHSECGHESIKAYIRGMAKKITVHDEQANFGAVLEQQYYGCGSSDLKQEPVGFEFDPLPPTA
ncbi:hypothetical protein BDW62DRAFT_176596 [Aspergillus aurantiobrunneus]